MSGRYTYFRMPTGKPYSGTDGKHAPSHLLAEIGKTATLNAEEAATWMGLFFPRFQVAIQSAFVIFGPDGDELNEQDTWSIIRAALVGLVTRAPGRPVIPNDLIAEVNRSAGAFYRKAPSKYVLVSSLSVADLPAKLIRVGGCTVTAIRERGKFVLPRMLNLQSHRAALSDHLNSTSYRLIKVTTEGRSIHEATSKALNAVNLLRGLWSLFATYNSWSMRFGGAARKPLGVIHTGPIHTLHVPDGRPVDENLYWYDPDFTEELPLFDRDESWGKIEQHRRRWMRRLAGLEYRRDLEDLLIRYAAALDQANMETAFLQMWGLLEKMTNTVGANYDETIKRTVRVFTTASRPIAKDTLESLRCLRNNYVHSGRAAQQGDQVAYLIKSFVDPHLVNLLTNRFKVGTLEEYGEFLALPSDVGVLEKRRRQLTKAIEAVKKEKASDPAP